MRDVQALLIIHFKHRAPQTTVNRCEPCADSCGPRKISESCGHEHVREDPQLSAIRRIISAHLATTHLPCGCATLRNILQSANRDVLDLSERRATYAQNTLVDMRGQAEIPRQQFPRNILVAFS